MASLEMSYGLPSSPYEGLRSQRTDVSKCRAAVPRTANNMAASTPGTADARHSPQLRPADRIPRALSTRRMGLPRPPLRLASNSPSIPSASSNRSLRHDTRIPPSHSPVPSRQVARSAGPPLARSNKTSLSRDATRPQRDAAPEGSLPASDTQGRFESDLSCGHVRNTNQKSSVARVPDREDLRRAVAPPPLIYPELDRYQTLQQPEINALHRLATQDLSPPTPASILFSGSSSQLSASPSTRFSESPGPGPYSRDTTPTSTCSQSPKFVRGIACARDQQDGSTRPPVTWRGLGSVSGENDAMAAAKSQGLAPVRESVASSSSSSTVRDGDGNAKRDGKAERQPSPLSSGPISGKSSQDSPTRKARILVPAPAMKATHKTGTAIRSLPKPESATPSRAALLSRAGPLHQPSRGGTPEMPHHSKAIATSQSSVSPLQRPSQRRTSEPVTSGSLPESLASLQQARRNASTPQLPVLRQTLSKAASPRVLAEPKMKGSSESSRSAQSSTKASSSFTTRFPFFDRKRIALEGPRSDCSEQSAQKKPGRKGPVAGTGHEGYGRFGIIRRRSSSGSSSSIGLAEPRPSESSLSSNDSFLADRVQPVVIAGGEVVQNKNLVTDLGSPETEKVVINGSPRGQRRAATELGALASKVQRTTLWPSPMSPDLQTSSGSLERCGDAIMTRPTIAFRRSVQRLRLSADNLMRLPQPIITKAPTSASSPMTSIDASIASEDSRSRWNRASSRGSNDSCQATKFPLKRARTSRKWNLFGRSQSRPNNKGDENEVKATVIAVGQKRVAFYAMMDSTEQSNGKTSSIVEDLLQHRPSEIRPTMCATSQSPSLTTRDACNEAEQPASRAVAADPALKSGKRGRLQQVGRIPQVISRRPPESTSLPTFSRPFRNSLQAAPRVVFDVYDPDSIAKGPSPPRPSTPASKWTAEDAAADSEVNSSSQEVTSKISPEVARGEREFLTFPSPRLSVRTIETTSSGSRDICIMPDATAIIPTWHDPPDEDEIWDEYNDLFDEDSDRMFSTPMTLEVRPLRLKSRRSRSIKGSSVQSAVMPRDIREASTYSKAPTHSTTGSADMTERIRRAFQPHTSQILGTQSSGIEPGVDKQRHNTLSAKVLGSVSNRNSSASGRTVFTDCSAVSSDDESPLAQVNLRVGSMTVSKWLSFGKVLFSDIRHELDLANSPAQKHSILVIDGLGNDDWSFYAAETYPLASFYNLSPRAALPADMRTCPSDFPLSPPNHKQVQYTSHLDKFPFAAQSFDGLVYRFPVAGPESHYRNIVNEARRVVRPGGYIELSVLDVDLNSMGNRGRRAVRRVKERIHQEGAEINLASTADLLLRLLGEAGFSGVRAARVGVPVAKCITRPKSEVTGRRDKATSSLAAMMRDNSPTADQSISKLVAKVGRWWYSRCYETISTDTSIWADNALLSECEELGTSLRLMVCCARAPCHGF